MAKTKKTAHDRINEALYEMAEGLYSVGAIDKVTMREYEKLRVPVVRELSANDIKKLRQREKVSQAIFAKYLNTTIYTVQEWEQGKKHPRGTSMKLLNLVAERGLAILSNPHVGHAENEAYQERSKSA